MEPVDEDDGVDGEDSVDPAITTALAYAFTAAAHSMGISEPYSVQEALSGPQCQE